VNFPKGFERRAFGPDLVDEKAEPIGKREWILNYEYFWDVTPLIDRLFR
jgi:hypothetical protein